MKKTDFYWSSVMLVGFVVYFLLMKVLGLYTNTYLRFFNFIIHFGVVYLAMRAYRAKSEDDFSFLDTFMAGVRASIPAVVLFVLFQYMYLKFLDPGLMATIVATAPMGEYLNPGMVALALSFEGLVGTFFSSYVGMRMLAMREKAEFPAM